MKNTAFCSLQIKSFDDEGIIRGIATTPTTDRAGDIVEPMGATFTLPLVLLHEHDRKAPLGQVIEATATPAGIEFVARIAKDATAGIGEVWQQIKAGLIPFVSIGFNPTESEPTSTGYRFKKWEWMELSLTTVPANPQAAIQYVKTTPQEHSTMTLAEQINSFQQKRQQAIARMDGLVTKGATLHGADAAEYDAAELEVAEISKHLDRLKAAERRQAQTAAPVVKGIPANVQVTDNAPLGSDFIRFTKALALSRGNPMQALEIAKGMGYGSRVETCLKAAVAAGTTTSAEYGALVEPALMASEFIDLLRPNLIMSKMTQTRAVPMNIKLPKATSGTSASWIGEGKPAPITNGAYADMVIGEHKIGAIVILTEELLRRSEPAAENLVRDDLIAATANAIDLAFIDQANAGIANVKPASIANAATTAATAGVTAAHVRTDVKAAYLAMTAANQPMSSAAWIMHPATALSLSMMVNATTSLREFPGVDFVNGGTFEGLPVIVSTNVPGTGVAGYDVILAVQGEILVAEGGIAIDASREASLEMDSAPVGNAATPTAAQLVSLWQNGAVAIKVIKATTWARRRPTAVYRISAAKYA